MATLTEQLDALIAEHGLASIGLTRIAHSDGSGSFWAVDAQAETPSGRLSGSSGYDQPDPSVALAAAIEALNVKRTRAVVVPELEAA